MDIKSAECSVPIETIPVFHDSGHCIFSRVSNSNLIYSLFVS